MATPKKKAIKKINTDGVLLKIWCVLNGWDDILIEALKTNNITTITQLKNQSVTDIIASINWTKCNQFTNKKKFNDALSELKKAKKLQIKYPAGSYGKKRKGGFRNKSKKYLSRSIPRMAAAPKMKTNKHRSRNKSAKRSSSMKEKKIGFSVGGAKDINSFRDNIMKNNRIPQLNSITFEGIYYDYYFNTDQKDDPDNVDNTPDNSDDNNNDDNKSPNNTDDNIDNDIDNDNDNKDDEKELPLFYPSYCYAKSIVPNSLLMQKSTNITKKTNDMIDDNDDDDDQIYDFHVSNNDNYEYFLTVGLNSNITENDFNRQNLNCVVVLDVSGSMSSSFMGSGSSNNKSKMKIANECVLSILTHLTNKDRFGLVLFDTGGWKQIDFKLMKKHKLNELASILDIYPRGGTNFEAGYQSALEMFMKYFNTNTDNNAYENRIIFLTDACPNIGITNPSSLMGIVQKHAVISDLKKRIFTTFVGVGLDFNANLISEITKVKGANYFAVHSADEFTQKLDLEFDYFVSPMVFDLKLVLQAEGGGACIDAVYGSNDINPVNGEVMNINTLFPSPPDDDGDIKGGIVLIKLKKVLNDKYDNLVVECSFENKFGKKFKNIQNVILSANDNNNNTEYYANLGVRKGILLTRYVLLMKEWINKFGQGSTIKTTPQYIQIFTTFKKYFEKEMVACNDPTLKKEIEILTKLINTK